MLLWDFGFENLVHRLPLETLNIVLSVKYQANKILAVINQLILKLNLTKLEKYV